MATLHYFSSIFTVVIVASHNTIKKNNREKKFFFVIFASSEFLCGVFVLHSVTILRMYESKCEMHSCVRMYD